MKKGKLQLYNLIENDNFQLLQDKLALATQLAMITVDFAGKPVTNHSSISPFCKYVRKDNTYSSQCEKCDSHGGLEAARLGKPYVYICHMGLVDLAVPIFADGVYLGAVMAGQIRLKGKNTGELSEIINERNSVDYDMPEEMKDCYDKLPSMTHEQINAVADVISHITNNYFETIISKLLGIEFSQTSNTEVTDYSRVSVVVVPAIEYIKANYTTDFNLLYLADLCRVSSSYLSRLFKREIGYSFRQYVNVLRVKRAKQELSSTNKSVSQISLEVGYDDCGYFIKVFKQLENITPNQYRNKYQLHKKIIINGIVRKSS